MSTLNSPQRLAARFGMFATIALMAIAVVVAAVAGVMHSALHLYSHAAGLLSTEHLVTEVLGIYIPAILLIAISAILYSQSDEPRATAARAA